MRRTQRYEEAALSEAKEPTLTKRGSRRTRRKSAIKKRREGDPRSLEGGRPPLYTRRRVHTSLHTSLYMSLHMSLHTSLHISPMRRCERRHARRAYEGTHRGIKEAIPTRNPTQRARSAPSSPTLHHYPLSPFPKSKLSHGEEISRPIDQSHATNHPPRRRKHFLRLALQSDSQVIDHPTHLHLEEESISFG